MFVSQKRYRELEQQLRSTVRAYQELHNLHDRLSRKWNKLVNRINDKGGEDFLIFGELQSESTFSKSEINQLIRLCHPDKHGNSSIANEMTKKLLALRQ